MVEFEKYEKNLLDDINSDIENHSEMSYDERCFLNGIIRYFKPKKILEVGVAHGGSSSVILNAIKDIENAKLYSIDYKKICYRARNKKSGYIVYEKFAPLADKWELYSGDVAAKYMDLIGSEIDMVLFDTVHSNPGEFLDYLMVLPYLKKNAIVIIHDTICHMWTYKATSGTCGALFSIIRGEKYYIESNNSPNSTSLQIEADEQLPFSNIGAVKLCDDAIENILDVFWILTFPWTYFPTDRDQEYIISLFNKFYDKKYVDNYIKTINIHKKRALQLEGAEIRGRDEEVKLKLNWFPTLFGIFNNSKYIKIIFLGFKINFNVNEEKINKMASFIPIKKWRDKFRSKF